MGQYVHTEEFRPRLIFPVNGHVDVLHDCRKTRPPTILATLSRAKDIIHIIIGRIALVELRFVMVTTMMMYA